MDPTSCARSLLYNKVAALMADIRLLSPSIFPTGRTGTFQTSRSLGARSPLARSGEGARISIMAWSAMPHFHQEAGHKILEPGTVVVQENQGSYNKNRIPRGRVLPFFLFLNQPSEK